MTTLVMLATSAVAQITSGMTSIGTANMRAALFFEICDISLYGSAETTKQNVLDGRDVALEIEYHRSISKETLIKYGDKGINKVWDSDTIEGFSDALATINEAYQDVDEGDVYRLESVGGDTLKLFLNGEPQVTIDQEGFPLFYMSIWLGEHKDARKIKKKIFSS
jgi:hypothetical protein